MDINSYLFVVAGEKQVLHWRDILQAGLPFLGKSLVSQLKRCCLLPYGRSSLSFLLFYSS